MYALDIFLCTITCVQCHFLYYLPQHFMYIDEEPIGSSLNKEHSYPYPILYEVNVECQTDLKCSTVGKLDHSGSNLTGFIFEV